VDGYRATRFPGTFTTTDTPLKDSRPSVTVVRRAYEGTCQGNMGATIPSKFPRAEPRRWHRARSSWRTITTGAFYGGRPCSNDAQVFRISYNLGAVEVLKVRGMAFVRVGAGGFINSSPRSPVFAMSGILASP